MTFIGWHEPEELIRFITNHLQSLKAKSKVGYFTCSCTAFAISGLTAVVIIWIKWEVCLVKLYC